MIVMTRHVRLTGLALLMALLILPAAWGEPPAGPVEEPSAEPPAEDEVDAVRQEAIRQQQRVRELYDRLEREIHEMADKLATTEPENAERLRRAFTFAREHMIADQMERAIGAIESRNLDRALSSQEGVSALLEELVGIIMGPADPSEMIEKYEEMVEEIDGILAEEREHQRNTDSLAERQRIEQWMGEVDRMLEQQRGIRGDGTPAEQAEAQDRLARAAQRMAEEMGQVEGEADTGGASGKMGEAGEAMRGAVEDLREGNPDAAREDQQDAEERLEEVREMLEEELRDLESLPKEEVEEGQADTFSRTERLGDRMRETGPDTPGMEDVGQAGEQMQRAGNNMRREHYRDAGENQQRAMDELQQAKEQLEEAIRQLRKKEQLEILRSLADRFARMLEEQERITADTVGIHGEIVTRGGEPNRAQWSRINALAGGEETLAAEAEAALAIVVEEGTTIVFPSVVEDLRDDLLHVGRRIRGGEVDPVTHALQHEIEETLAMLLEALMEEIEMIQQEQQQQQQQDPSEPPPAQLLPDTAELKLLLWMQKRVNRLTVAFDETRGEESVTEGMRAELDRLAGRQEDVANKTLELHQRYFKQD